MSPDPETGASYFDFELRNNFHYFDDDKDGTITVREFAEFLKHDTRQITYLSEQEELDALNPSFLKNATDMIKILNDDYTNCQTIAWNEFKQLRMKCKKKHATLCTFLKTHFADKQQKLGAGGDYSSTD